MKIIDLYKRRREKKNERNKCPVLHCEYKALVILDMRAYTRRKNTSKASEITASKSLHNVVYNNDH